MENGNLTIGMNNAMVPAGGPAEDSGAFRNLGISSAEADILYWVAEGKRNREIATIRGISPRTVEKHVQKLLAKLGVETRTAAAVVAIAHRRGLNSTEIVNG